MHNISHAVHPDDPIKRRLVRYVSLNSFDRLHRTPYDTDFRVPFDVTGEPQGFLIDVMSVTLPNGVFPINSLNNRIYVREVGDVYEVSVPPNNYNGSGFASQIQDALNSNGNLAGVWTVTYDSQKEYLTVSSTVSYSFEQILIGDERFDMYDEMGYDKDALPLNVTSSTSIGPVNLGGTNLVYVKSSLGGTYLTGNNIRGILAEVPMDVPYGSVTHYYPPKSFQTWVSSTHIQDFGVQLLDSKGRLWPMPNNLHWTLTLRIEQLPPTHRIGNITSIVDGYRSFISEEMEESFKRRRMNE